MVKNNEIKTALDKKIEDLERQLKESKALKNKTERKERNSQLIAFGVLLEIKYKSLTKEEQVKIEAWANELLTGRNLEKSIAGFERIKNK